MCSRYLGFILLVWFPGALHAQSAAQPCPAPSLDGGYFFPVKERYPHDSQLNYACESLLKPAVEGWWADSVCQNGVWSPKPRCIEEEACILPTIANAKYTEDSEGWHKEGHTIRITCNKGYEHKDNMATAKCTNGTWSSLPSCEISSKSCPVPPQDPHAVIIDQGYQELFPQDAEVKYECQVGYSIEGSPNYTRICLAGTWSDGQMCSKETGRGGGHGGGHSTSSGRVTQPGDRRPDTGHGGSADTGTGGGDRTSSGRGTQPGGGGGGGSRSDIGHGSSEVGPGGGHSTSSGPGTQPGSGGSTSTSANRPLFISIDNCGTNPVVPNGVVVQKERMYLKFKCQNFYKQVGEETVTCYNDGSWSKVPVCEDAFCVMEPGYYVPGLEVPLAMFIKEGETEYIPCTRQDHSLAVHCSNRRITHTGCKDTGRGGGHGGSAEAGTSRGHSTSSGRGTQLAVEDPPAPLPTGLSLYPLKAVEYDPVSPMGILWKQERCF
ncbi:complement factor H-related protein 5-like isoform X2 [Limanda limanda]|uniref:complement factor H-related protein 5-like isoform X2 n=1 Tax=Limanda limanda TaxID=27771 RepID=UPI0029C7EC8B|nr:complement factor H-related protein 5-like isoform X2 [Limanda limanda]